MDVRKQFIIDSDQIYRPKYNIGPFSNFGSLGIRKRHIDCDALLRALFPNKEVCLTRSGKHAISLALEQLHLSKEDCVTIKTTSGNSYISRCVTDEIEKVCQWSMIVEPSTKVLFVNHEFGFPYHDLRKLNEAHDFPIIEDVAHGLYSQNPEKSVGVVGDFVVCSLPKIFPMQMGGALMHGSGYHVNSALTEPEISYINESIQIYGSDKDDLIAKRRSNYRYLEKRFNTIGASSFFDLADDVNPGVFMFTLADFIQWDKLKVFMQSNGVESSVFYGEDAFFIPVHQNLERADMDYFVELVDYFLHQEY